MVKGSTYSYSLDLSGIKIPDTPEKTEAVKKYICIDLEMTELTPEQHRDLPGLNGEIIQFGAVMLDENYNFIKKFDFYVKPVYSSVTESIKELTGITNEMLAGAEDFTAVFQKFCRWRGEGYITTFCWSKADHLQLCKELELKCLDRKELSKSLKYFVDLQKIYGNMVAAKTSVSLESALNLILMNYKGQVHNAYWDAYNTARILHKIYCTEGLDLNRKHFKSETKSKNTDTEKYHEKKRLAKKKKSVYSCTFASFLSPELLERFGYTENGEDKSLKMPEASEVSDRNISGQSGNSAENSSGEELTEEEKLIRKEKEDLYSPEKVEGYFKLLENSELKSLVDKEKIMGLCKKYKLIFDLWLKAAEKIIKTGEMHE